MDPRDPNIPEDPRRGVPLPPPIVDPTIPQPPRVEGEYYVDPLEAERFDREIGDEKLERDNKMLIALTVLSLLVGGAGLFFGLTAKNQAEDAEARANASAARSTGAAQISSEVNRQLQAKENALQAGQRSAANQARAANKSAGSANDLAQENAAKISSLTTQNEQLSAQINTLRRANQSTNQRLDSLTSVP